MPFDLPVAVLTRLLVFDLATRKVEEVPIPHPPFDPTDPNKGRYMLDIKGRGRPLPQWLGNEEFLVALVWHSQDYTESRSKFLRYAVARLDSPEEVTFDVKSPYMLAAPAGTLLVGDSKEPTIPPKWRTVQVPEPAAVRPATEAERQSYVHLYRTEYSKPPVGPQQAVVERVTESRFTFHPDWDYEIRFGARLIRRADEGGDDLRWEAELGLYIWSEYVGCGPNWERPTFVADQAGRYRRWHAADYVGSVPAGMIHLDKAR